MIGIINEKIDDLLKISLMSKMVKDKSNK